MYFKLSDKLYRVIPWQIIASIHLADASWFGLGKTPSNLLETKLSNVSRA